MDQDNNSLDQNNKSLDQEKKLRDVQHEREVAIVKQVFIK